MAKQPRVEIRYPKTSSEELMDLDPDSFWKNEENIKSISKGLSDSDLKALDIVLESLNNNLNYASRQELISRLRYRGFSEGEAEPIIDLCQIDFKMQALKRTLYMMNDTSFSPYTLKENLMNSGFSSEDADYAIEHCETNWDLQTKHTIQSYLYRFEISEQSLCDQMEDEKYDAVVVKKYIENLHPDWERECLQAALSYPYRKPEELQEFLESEKFTSEQIDYVLKFIY